MQLKIQRSQRVSITNKVIFCLDIRADYSAEERHNIERYRLGSQGIYNSRAAEKHFAAAETHLEGSRSGTEAQRWGSLLKGTVSAALAHMQLNVTVASLAKGHHIECKDLEELLQAEDTLRNACKNVTRYLEVAATFDGSETVIAYDKGEERVHVAQNVPPLIAYAMAPAAEALEPAMAAQDTEPVGEAFEEMGKDFTLAGNMLKTRWLGIERRLMAFASSKGWNVDAFTVRLACGATGLVTIIILWNIL
jgi:hypothetical protein